MTEQRDDEVRALLVKHAGAYLREVKAEAMAWQQLQELLREVSKLFDGIATRGGLTPNEAATYSFLSCGAGTIIEVLRQRYQERRLYTADITRELLARLEELAASKPIKTVKEIEG